MLCLRKNIVLTSKYQKEFSRPEYSKFSTLIMVYYIIITSKLEYIYLQSGMIYPQVVPTT